MSLYLLGRMDLIKRVEALQATILRESARHRLRADNPIQKGVCACDLCALAGTFGVTAAGTES